MVDEVEEVAGRSTWGQVGEENRNPGRGGRRSAIFLGGLAGGFVRWFGEWGGRGVTARVGLSPPDDGDSALMGLASGLADWLLARWNCANVRVPGKETLQEAGLSSWRWLRGRRPLLGHTPPWGSQGGPTTHHRGQAYTLNSTFRALPERSVLCMRRGRIQLDDPAVTREKSESPSQTAFRLVP